MLTKRTGLIASIFLLVSVVALMALADRNGYEGDDLNSILPMIHLDQAKRGELLIYRYGWQPLAYEVGAAVFGITRTPSTIFLLAPIAGAVSLTLLLLTAWDDKRSWSGLGKALIALLAIPELWFSGLYFNSTVLGLPFACAAMLLLRWSAGPASFLPGFLLGIATLMRLDFGLTVGVFSLLAWKQNRSLREVLLFNCAVFATVGVSYFAGLFNPREILDIYAASTREMADKAQSPGWDLRTKLGVLSVLVSPLGWVILILGGPVAALRCYREGKIASLAWVVAIAPVCLSLPNLLSVKYALPLLMFFPAILVECLSSTERAVSAPLWKWPLFISGAATVGLLFFSASFYGRPPYLVLETRPSREVGTHDGTRSYGGYFWQMLAVERGAEPTPHQEFAQKVLGELREVNGPDIVVAGDENFFNPGGAGWRDLQLSLEADGIHGSIVAPHTIQFELNGRRLTLIRDVPAQIDAGLNRGRGLKVYDLREKPRGE
jgi:hypothetical protein